MNKSLFKIISVFLALIISALALYSCGDEPQPCTEHKDDNLDGLCDVCEATLEPPAPSCDHRDENGDYVCDKCDADFFPSYSSPSIFVIVTLTPERIAPSWSETLKVTFIGKSSPHISQ